MITHVGGHELARSTVLSILASDAQDRAEQRAREEYAEARREEVVARAETYYREHGEWEWETRAREQDVLARAEARAEEKRQIEAAERQQAQQAQLLMAGHQPRTIQEILAVAALYP